MEEFTRDESVATTAATHLFRSDRQLGEDERTIVHENVARVRATLNWIKTAVDTGDVDGELAKLLQGE